MCSATTKKTGGGDQTHERGKKTTYIQKRKGKTLMMERKKKDG